jgi:predicted Mrr-cat superfamily restriction endonuclease
MSLGLASMPKGKRTWTVRGVEGLIATDFHKTGRVAFGWNDVGDLMVFTGIEELAQNVRMRYPDLDESAVAWASRGLWWLREELQLGDTVVAHDPERNVFCMGVVGSRYEHDERSSALHHVRKVRWIKDIGPDGLSPRSVESMTSVSSIGDLDDDINKELRRSKTDTTGVDELIDDVAWIMLALSDY